MFRFSFTCALLLTTAVLNAQTIFVPGRTYLAFGVPPGSSNRDLTMNADETVCVFASNRPGSAGGWDLWIATRPSRGAAWGAPRPWAGNTPDDETGPGLSSNGAELYFSRKGSGRDADLFVAVAAPGSTAYGSPRPAIQLSAPGADDTGPQLTVDGLRIFFHSDRRGGGDLFMASRGAPGGSWSAPQPVPVINDPTAMDYDPAPQAGGAILWFSRRAPNGDADFYLTWLQASTGVWTTPMAVAELNDGADQDGFFTASVSGLTYFNAPSGAIDIGLECVCRNGPVGGTPKLPTGWADGRTSGGWNLPVQITTGAAWELGRSASLSFFDWAATGPLAYVPAISPQRAPAPVSLPILEWGVVELQAGAIVTLGRVAVDASGYAEFILPVPNRPDLRGQVLWSQAFGLTRTGIQMTQPQRITLR